MKRTISLVLAFTMLCCMLFLGAGCMDFDSYNNNLKKNGNDAIKYISEKYDREFIPLSYDLSDYLSDQDEVECYTDGMDPENEHASVFLAKENEEMVFHDNYFGYIIRPEIEEEVSVLLKKEFQTFKVYKGDDLVWLSDELDADSTIDDLFLQEPEYRIEVSVFVKYDPQDDPGEYDIKVHRFEKALAAAGRNYRVALFVVGDEMYDKITRYEQDRFWTVYAKSAEPDNNNYYYEYHSYITEGEIEER